MGAKQGNGDIAALMRDMGLRARAAARTLALAAPDNKTKALRAAAKALRANASAILQANAEDIAAAREKDTTPAFIDRLSLDSKRVEAMAEGVETVAALPDPVGEVIARWTRPNGLQFERVRTPLGVVAVIYESRPNVTADAGALCVKAGNAAILRGGSESFRSSRAIHAALTQGLASEGLPADAIQLVPTRDRAAARTWSAGSRPRRAFPCSRTSKASATSMCTRPPISPWPRTSCSTRRCAAPACAAPPRRCSWTAHWRRVTCSHWSPC